MLYQKKVSVGSFLKKGIDFKDGDMLEVANEGKQIEGQFGAQDIFMVKTEDGKEGNVNFNQTTINGLIDAFSKDSINWIGKKVKAVKVKQNVAGKFIDVWYFAHPDAELTENGFVLPNKDEDESEEEEERGKVIGKKIFKGKIVKGKNPEEEEEEEISVKDIPFR